MATNRKIIKVFLASPGDMKDERQAAKQVVDGFNKQWADYLGVQIELVGWEDTVSQFGRPQSVINRDLDQCEVFVGMMWKHWGSPPDNEGKYTSGFEEEFERSINSRKTSGRPEISLLFKAIDPDQLKDPGDALRKVVAFKENIVAEKTVLFQDFNNSRDFETKILGCITNYVQSVLAEEAQKISEESSARANEGVQPEKASEPAKVVTPLSTEGAQFLRDFIAKTERDRESSPILPEEVARFRLISSLVSAGGNDEAAIGVHDANILFAKRSEIDFSQREMNGLIDSALDHYSHHVVPLWHWYVAANAEKRGYLSLESFIGSSSQRIGALGVMRFLCEPVNLPLYSETEDKDKSRRVVVDSWFSEGTDYRLRVAALEYLASCGESGDLEVIRKEFDKGNYQTVGPATQALIRLNLKQSRDDAITVLLELQPESVDDGLIDKLFDRPAGVETSLLVKGVTHRSSKVRRTVVPFLVEHKALEATVAEQLLADTDAVVRYWALRSLINSGREFSDEKARGILVKPANRSGFGGLLGGGSVPDSEGEKQYQRYLKEKFRKLDTKSLKRLVESESIFEKDARLALDYKNFSTRATTLRESVDNKFKVEFDADFKALEQQLGVDSDSVKRVLSIEPHLRKEFTRKGLDILCEKADPNDLPRIRAALAEGFVDYNDLDLSYLRHHGEWQDISLLLKLVERGGSGTSLSLFMFDDGEKMKGIANAICVIARGRLADLLVMTMPDRLRALVLMRAPEKEVPGLKDDEILKHLFSESDQVRTAIAIKTIRSLPKARLKALLERYTNHGEHRYYNAIHWLDLGISMPKSKVSQATANSLSKEG